MNNIPNFELIEILVNSGSTAQRIYFGDQPKLRNSALLGVESFSADNIATAPSGTAVVPESAFAVSYIVFVDADTNTERLFNIPLVQTRRTHSQTSTFQFVMNLDGFSGMNVNYSKSYIYIADPTEAANVAGKSFCVGIKYNTRGAERAQQSSILKR